MSILKYRIRDAFNGSLEVRIIKDLNSMLVWGGMTMA